MEPERLELLSLLDGNSRRFKKKFRDWNSCIRRFEPSELTPSSEGLEQPKDFVSELKTIVECSETLRLCMWDPTNELAFSTAAVSKTGTVNKKRELAIKTIILYKADRHF